MKKAGVSILKFIGNVISFFLGIISFVNILIFSLLYVITNFIDKDLLLSLISQLNPGQGDIQLINMIYNNEYILPMIILFVVLFSLMSLFSFNIKKTMRKHGMYFISVGISNMLISNLDTLLSNVITPEIFPAFEEIKPKLFYTSSRIGIISIIIGSIFIIILIALKFKKYFNEDKETREAKKLEPTEETKTVVIPSSAPTFRSTEELYNQTIEEENIQDTVEEPTIQNIVINNVEPIAINNTEQPVFETEQVEEPILNEESIPKYCSNCGDNIDEYTVYCSNCGQNDKI